MRFAVFAVAALAASGATAAPSNGMRPLKTRDVATQKLASVSAASKARAVGMAAEALSILETGSATQQVKLLNQQRKKKIKTKKPKLPKLPGNGLLQDGECSSHGDCIEGEEYCDRYTDCYECGACPSSQDSIDGVCPPCSGASEGGSGDDDLLAQCVLQNSGACLTGLYNGLFEDIFEGDSEESVVATLNDFCADCTDATGELEQAFVACDITADDEESDFVRQMLLAIGEFVDNACDDPECAAGMIWAFDDITERQDTFCENQECGLDLLSPLLEILSGAVESEVSGECIGEFFGLFCLADADSGEYCMNTLNTLDESVAPFCDTTCPSDLTVKFSEISQLDCGFDDFDLSFDSCDDGIEYTILDYCTENADGDYCLDLLTTVDSPDCEFEGMEDQETLVPAPGQDGTDTAVCPEECSSQLENYLETLGCCAKWSLDIACVDDAIVDFVTDDCGIALGEDCERPVLAASSSASAKVLSAVFAVAAAVASVAALM